MKHPVSCFLSSFFEFLAAVSDKMSKMSKSIRGPGGHLVFPIGPKNTTLVEYVEILLPVKCRWNLLSGFRGEVEKGLSQSEAEAAIGLKNIYFKEDVEILLPIKFCRILFSDFRGEAENISANQRPWRPSCFFDRPENANLMVENVEILLPVKFRWILCSSFKGEVKNVLANQRPRRPSCVSYRRKKTQTW